MENFLKGLIHTFFTGGMFWFCWSVGMALTGQVELWYDKSFDVAVVAAVMACVVEIMWCCASPGEREYIGYF